MPLGGVQCTATRAAPSPAAKMRQLSGAVDMKPDRTGAIAAALLAAATLAVFARTLGHQFLNFDDTLYVTANPAVTAGLSAPGLALGLHQHPMRATGTR